MEIVVRTVVIFFFILVLTRAIGRNQEDQLERGQLGELLHLWRALRRFVRGLAVVVVRDGRAVEEAMRIERLTIDDVIEGAREQGIDDLGEVKLAVLEPDGKFDRAGPSGAGQAVAGRRTQAVSGR